MQFRRNVVQKKMQCKACDEVKPEQPDGCEDFAEEA